MSIADKITSMTNHLEKDYQALESVVGTISVNKNIENIAPLLDNLWEDLPKTTGSGTTPSISDTRAGKMKVNLLGNTSQTGIPSPNPSYPQPINVVSGDNEVVVCGKNIVSSFSRAGNQVYLNGSTSTTSYIFKAGTYTISYKNNTNNTAFVFMRKPSSSGNENVDSGSPVTFTSNEDFNVWIYMSGMQDGDISEVQLEVGSTATNYEPYQSSTYEIDLPVENLFNKNAVVMGEKYNSSGNIENNNSCARIDEYINCYGFGNITISGAGDGGGSAIIFYDENKQYLDYYTFKNRTIPIPDGTYYFRPSVLTTYLDTIQLEKGTKANSYTPYGTTPIELCKIGTYQDKFIKNSGKNLFDKDNANILNGYIDTSTIVSNGNYKSYYIECKPNTTYTISRTGTSSLYACTSQTTPTLSGSISNKTNGNTSSVTITTDANANYLIVQAYRSSYDDATTVLDTLMINEGETALPYEPFGNGDWYLEKHIGKVVLDGSESYTNATAYYYILFSQITPRPRPSSSLFSNYFINTAEGGNGGIWAGTGALAFNKNGLPSTITDLANFKTWLGNNNTTVYYQMTTPTYTKIEGTLAEQLEDVWRASSYKGQTNISQINNDLPFNLDATALEG